MFRRKEEFNFRCPASQVPVKHSNKYFQQSIEIGKPQPKEIQTLTLYKGRNVDELTEEDMMQTEKTLVSIDRKFQQFQKFHFSYLVLVFDTINMFILRKLFL